MIHRDSAAMPLQPSHSNIAADDWDDLFVAVEARLRSCVSQQLTKTPQLQLQDPAALVEAIVLECVAALDQLHAALKRERLHRRELVIDHFVASNRCDACDADRHTSENSTLPAGATTEPKTQTPAP